MNSRRALHPHVAMRLSAQNLRQRRLQRPHGKPGMARRTDGLPGLPVLIRARHRASATDLQVLPPKCQDKAAEAEDRNPHRKVADHRPPWSRFPSPGRPSSRPSARRRSEVTRVRALRRRRCAIFAGLRGTHCQHSPRRTIRDACLERGGRFVQPCQSPLNAEQLRNNGHDMLSFNITNLMRPTAARAKPKRPRSAKWKRHALPR